MLSIVARLEFRHRHASSVVVESIADADIDDISDDSPGLRSAAILPFGWNGSRRASERVEKPAPPGMIWPRCHAGCLSVAASTGIFRSLLPVAAKIAFAIAGTIAEVPGSPIPPGGSSLSTICTSMDGASSIRSIW